MRKADNYQVSVAITGMVTVKGRRSLGEFFFRTGKGRFHQKDNYDSSLSTAPAYTFPPAFVAECLKLWQDAYSDLTKTTFIYRTDPGHGWLGVPIWLLQDLELTDKITRYSYLSQDGLFAHLEEDQDMTTFINAFTSRFGQAASIKEMDDSGYRGLRDLPSYSVDRFSSLLTPNDENQTPN